MFAFVYHNSRCRGALGRLYVMLVPLQYLCNIEFLKKNDFKQISACMMLVGVQVLDLTKTLFCLNALSLFILNWDQSFAIQMLP